jgi:hypothetical protein
MTIPTEDSWSEIMVVPDATNTVHIVIDDGEEDTTVRPSELARRMAKHYLHEDLPPFDAQSDLPAIHVRLDDAEEDNTVRTSSEIRRFCAELRQRFGEDTASAPPATVSDHERLSEDDPGAEVWSWAPPPPPVPDESKG